MNYKPKYKTGASTEKVILKNIVNKVTRCKGKIRVLSAFVTA